MRRVLGRCCDGIGRTDFRGIKNFYPEGIASISPALHRTLSELRWVDGKSGNNSEGVVAAVCDRRSWPERATVIERRYREDATPLG